MRVNVVAPAVLVFLLAATSACAQPYYADVRVNVDSAGLSIISGRTNHPLLKVDATDALTSKRGSYWLFNLTLPKDDVFSDYVYVVELPDGASVNYVKTRGPFRISSTESKISVSGTGKNESMSIMIQYRVGAEQNINYTPYSITSVVFVILVVLVGYFIFRKLRSKPKPVEEEEEISYDPNMLTERQNDIMRVIKEASKPVNQSFICDKLGLAKSSVSRNVESLVRIGLVKKTRTGMSTLLSLKEEK